MRFDANAFSHAVGAAMLVIWLARFVAVQFPERRVWLRAMAFRALGSGR